MSIVKIMNHDESIQNILHKPPPPEPKPPRYVSKYKTFIKPSKDRKDYSAVGVAKLNVKGPDEFLKKGEGVKRAIPIAHKQCLADEALPKLPTRVATCLNRNNPSMNFIKRNATSAQSLQPGRPQKFVVDSPNGHKFLTDNVNPKYLFIKQYGHVPRYLIKRNKSIRDTENRYREGLENKKHLCEMIDEDERDSLLKGLKENWSLLQKSFLRLPLCIDTVSLINKKKKVENKMNEIEKHIKFLEENPYIYIYDD